MVIFSPSFLAPILNSLVTAFLFFHFKDPCFKKTDPECEVGLEKISHPEINAGGKCCTCGVFFFPFWSLFLQYSSPRLVVDLCSSSVHMLKFTMISIWKFNQIRFYELKFNIFSPLSTAKYHHFIKSLFLNESFLECCFG